jgi:uncharacterized protein (TIGR02679 family)
VTDHRDLSPALAPVWQAVHARLSSGRPVSRVRVGPLDPAGRAALADLLGLERLPAEYVSLDRLDAVLRAAVGAGVDEVVETLVGPVADRAGDRQRAAAERAELWDWLDRHPVVAASAPLLEWAASVRRGGLVAGSVPRTRRELDRVLRVLAELPAAGDPLPVFAERVLGDPHALDDPGRCAGLVLRALAGSYDLPPPVDAESRQALWERVGVTSDVLSSTVLAAGLRPAGQDLVARMLRAAAEAGHAAVLTLGQLRAAGPWAAVPAVVWVFENPAMVALALDRFGDRCPPLVCTSGWPSAAGILLLRRLAAAGAGLRYHGDLDGEGLRIAANVAARTGAQPWRMTSADYLAAVGTGPPVGRVTPAPWDADLAGHLTRVGTAVPEERVAATLLAELRI